MGPGIVRRMGNFIYRVFSFRGSITVCGTVSAAGKCILCIGSHQLLCGVGNLEDHFIVFGERNCRLRALIDTGNTVKDTVSKDPVSVMDQASVKRLTEGKQPERFRYIPYHSIGKKEGVMPAFRMDKIQIIRDGYRINVEHPLVAVCEEELGSENYQMIINPDILAGGKKNGDKSSSSTSV